MCGSPTKGDGRFYGSHRPSRSVGSGREVVLDTRDLGPEYPAYGIGFRLEAHMKTVQQVLHAKAGLVLSVTEDTTVYDALTVLARHDVGALVVLDGGRLAGMFSERDYARKVILHGKSSKELLVSEVMTRRVHSVGPADTVEHCMALMTHARIRHLPVVQDDTVVGMISIGDVVKATLDEQRFTITVLEQYITT